MCFNDGDISCACPANTFCNKDTLGLTTSGKAYCTVRGLKAMLSTPCRGLHMRRVRAVLKCKGDG